jgi:hypothetical protein
VAYLQVNNSVQLLVGRLRIPLVRHSLCWMLVKMRHSTGFAKVYHQKLYRI